MTKLGIPLPKTVLLPSNDRPANTSETSFRNLTFPHNWDYIFNYVGFPAYMKPHDGGGWRNVYRVENPEDLWNKLSETEQLVMMVQEEIIFEDYYRVYCLGKNMFISCLMNQEIHIIYAMRQNLSIPENNWKIC